MKHLILAASLLMAGTAVSYAADASRFDGTYAGVFIGYAGASFDGVVDSSEIVDGYPEEAEIFSTDPAFGPTASLVVGMNHVDQDKVFGLELSVTGGNLSALAIDSGGNDYSSHRIDAVAIAAGRAGIAVTPDTLLFGKAGLGLMASTFTANNDMDDPDLAETGSLRIVRPVVAIGAGVEQAVTDTISLRVDGTYVLPIGQYDFSNEQLTSDMDDGDYAKVAGVVILSAGVVARF